MSSERVTVRLAEEQDEILDDVVEAGLYLNRSEAIRDGLRHALAERDAVALARDPLIDRRGGHAPRVSRIAPSRTRESVRVPPRLKEEIDARFYSYAEAVRRAVNLVASESLEEAPA